MRRFIRYVLLAAAFLGGYYLGHLPDSPDIFGWGASAYQRVDDATSDIAAKAEQENIGVTEAAVSYLLSETSRPKD